MQLVREIIQSWIIYFTDIGTLHRQQNVYALVYITHQPNTQCVYLSQKCMPDANDSLSLVCYNPLQMPPVIGHRLHRLLKTFAHVIDQNLRLLWLSLPASVWPQWTHSAAPCGLSLMGHKQQYIWSNKPWFTHSSLELLWGSSGD